MTFSLNKLLGVVFSSFPAPANFPAMSAGPALHAVSLADLPRGSFAKVAEVRVDGGDALRLKALGVCSGRNVQIVQTGDPLILRVVGTRVGLSARLAAEVFVEIVDPNAPLHGEGKSS